MIGLMMMIAAASLPVTAPGSQGPLAGTLEDAGKGAPVVLMIPGSGPTDRDGNSPRGLTAGSLRLLAEGLAADGVSSVRVDKRGMFGSKAAIADPNKVTIGDYAADVHSWVKAIRARTGAGCVWVLGHSEGSLVALAAAQQPGGICGVISVSGAGRRLGDVIREQLHASPAFAPTLDRDLAALDSLERGQRVDTAAMSPLELQLFAPQVQDYLMDLLHYDPAKLASTLKLPFLIIQGERDLQVSVADAKALATAQPKAKLVLVPAMNHVLKDVASDDRAANIATYSDSSLPVDSALVGAIAAFVKR